MNRGFLITRGLGCKGLLVTRGLGGCRLIILPPEPEDRPRQTNPVFRGGSRKKRKKIECITVGAKLIAINGEELYFPVEGDVVIDCNDDPNVKIIAKMPKVKRRIKRIVINTRIIK